MKLCNVDAAVALWVIITSAAFIVPLIFCVGRLELELVGRYVYLGVVSVGLISLALKATRTIRR